VTTLEFLCRLRDLGIGVAAADGRLRVQAPPGVLTAELRGELAARRDELVAALAGAAAGAGHATTIPRVPRDRPLPLSFAQQRLWFLQQLDPAGVAYNVPAALRFTGRLDRWALGRALTEIVARHEVLRTSFPAPDGTPYQRVHQPAPLDLPLVDAGAEPDPVLAADRAVAAAAGEPFDLLTEPGLRARLVRLCDEDHVLVLVLHHIVCDEWSAGVLREELSALYAAFTAGRPSPLPSLPVQYADYAVWQRAWLSGDRLTEQLRYWRARLSGLQPLDLPTDRPRPLARSAAGGVVEFTVPDEVTAGLRLLCRRHGVTSFMVLLAAFQVLLGRYTGRDDPAVGVPVAGRTRAEVEPLIGFFANTLVLRAELAGDPPFAELLGRVRAAALGAFAHQDLPFEVLVDALGEDRDPSRNPLFDVMFRVERQRGEPGLPGLGGCELPVPSHTAKFDLALAVTEAPTGLWGGLEYAADLFDRATAHRLARHFTTLLAGIAGGAGRRLSELPVLGGGELATLLGDRERTATAAVLRGPALPQQVAGLAALRPDAPAVACGDTVLSRAELQARAGRVARLLRRAGAGRGTLVAVCLERGVDLPVALLAVLTTGAAYLPLDPSHPPERLTRLIDHAAPACVLTASRVFAGTDGVFAGTAPAAATPPVILLDDAPHTDAIDENVTPHEDELAYVIYTSGSTGTPKGVAVTHGALRNLLAAFRPIVPLAEGDELLAVTTVAFDIAALELFLPLVQGGCVRVADRDQVRDPVALAALLAAPRVRAMQATPATWRMLLDWGLLDWGLLDWGWAGRADLTALCGGEALPAALAEALAGRVGAAWNVYGPTETTIWSTAWRIPPAPSPGPRPGPAWPTAPIGTPLANTACYVLDRRGNPVPPGATGELYLGGAGLARGYLHAPDTTAERFVADPFGGDGGRLYRTGDLVRRAADGTLRFLGRIDDQVKIRGHRVEPAEVEAVLAEYPGRAEHPKLSAVAVTSRPGPDGEPELVAFAVPAHGSAGQPPVHRLAAEQLEQWRAVWETAVADAPDDPAFDVTGWVASATGEPIPAEHMREWVDGAVERIRALAPRRVLEIGCGTGLLLWRLAGDCDRYDATDVAEAPLRALRDRLPADLAERVRLMRREATELDDLPDDGYDLVVITSVAQYFPHVDHLIDVLRHAVRLVRPHGQVFLGDLRSLPLLPVHHAEVALAQAAAGTDAAAVRRRAARALRRENELVIDPRLFAVLASQFGIPHVQVLPKAGPSVNELTRYRYDVILHTRQPPVVAPERWLDWAQAGGSSAAVRRLLGDAPPVLGLTGIPNARLRPAPPFGDDVTFPRLERHDVTSSSNRNTAVDPAALADLATEHGYAVELSWAAGHPDGAVDAIFVRRRPGDGDSRGGLLGGFPPVDAGGQPRDYATDPIAARHREAAERRLASELREHAEWRLPGYLVPAAITVLDELPLNPSGKVDRRALAALDDRPAGPPGPPEPPATPTERQLAAIWAEVLGLPLVNRRDDFFRLGGHSLLAVQVVSRIRARMGRDLPLRAMFDSPVLAELAAVLESAAPADAAPIVPVDRGRPQPASYAQQRLWFLHRLDPTGGAYHLRFTSRLCGPLHVDAVRQALSAIIHRHEALRTTFDAPDGTPLQVIGDPAPVELPVIDLTEAADPQAAHPQAADPQAATMVRAAAARPFDLATGPLVRPLLLRLGADDHVLAVTVHHIACDDRSVELLADELSALYEAFRDGHPSPLEPLPAQYADLAQWQRSALSGNRLDEQLDYWRDRLRGLQQLELPTDRPYPTVADPAAAWVDVEVPAVVTRRLAAIATGRQASMFMLVVAALDVLLTRYSRQDDLVVGTPVSGRNRPEAEPLIGLFLNTLVLRTDTSGDPPFTALLDRVREAALGAYAHQDLPFEQLVDELAPRRDRGRHPLFQVIVNYTEDEPTGAHPPAEPAAEPALPGLQVSPFAGRPDTGKFDLRLVVQRRDDTLHAALQYRRQLFDATTVQWMAEQFGCLLAAVADDPDRPIGDLPLERADPDAASGRTPHPVAAGEPLGQHGPHGPPPLLPELVTAAAAQHPSAPVVRDGDRTLSHRELITAADALAGRLRAAGAGRETVVALMVGHTVDLIVAVLATWRAGAGYLALDPADPLPRLSAQLTASRAAVVLTTEALADTLPVTALPVIVLDEPDGAPAMVTLDPPLPDNLAYLVFTSGTTGPAKPVAVTHAALASYLHGILARLGLQMGPRPGASWVLVQPLSVDLGLTAIVLALATGGRLDLLSPVEARDPACLAGGLAASRPDYLKLTPTHVRMLLSAGGRRAAAALPRRALLLGGEAAPADLPPALAAAGFTGVLINHYGPTETTVGALTHTAPGLATASLPLGRPLPGVTCHILDRRGRPCANGVPGELYLGGPGLARGYPDRPDLTAERFVPDPAAATGSRLYRTGDRVRLRPDGTLQFLGRVDDQLNVNGFRAEPGEVEAALGAHPAVAAAAVDTRPSATATTRLVAWFVPADGDRPPAADELRSFLGSRLPPHLVPAAYLQVDALPLRPNGKVDRRALPDPDGSRPQLVVRYEPPATATELAVAAIWTALLGIDRAGRDDDFFDLGGNSLLATRMVSRVRDELGVELPVAAVFEHPTLAQIAAQIDAQIETLRRVSAAGVPGYPDARLVRMNSMAAPRQVFCTPPLNGSAFCYRPLAAGLAPVTGFIGLQARGLTTDDPPFERVEDMARYYVEAIRGEQPSGPYLIAGWSFGSMVALEVAQQLHASGAVVDTLVLIGPTNIRRTHRSPQIGPHETGRLRRLAADLLTGGAREREDLALALHPLACEPEFAGDPASYDAALLFRRLRLLAAHRVAASRYRPRRYPGRCLLVLPEALHEDDERIVAQWRAIITGDVQFATTPGDHESMVMDADNAAHLAACLRERLAYRPL
jgi:pristinamycin I synthase 3 and 4